MAWNIQRGGSPWGGDGGHILWSDGTRIYYNDTHGDDGKGIFEDENEERTSNVENAIPADWEILKP